MIPGILRVVPEQTAHIYKDKLQTGQVFSQLVFAEVMQFKLLRPSIVGAAEGIRDARSVYSAALKTP
jgi:hypothetical protein